MSLLYRVRDTVRTTRDALTADRGKLDAPGSSDLRTVWASGALAAGVSWLAVLVLGVMAWALSPASDVGWQQVIGVSSAAWLLGHGATVHVESVSFSIVPLGVWLGAAAAAAYLLSHVLVRHDDALRRLLPRFLGGYAAVLAAAAAISLSGPARPTLAGLLCALSAPVVGQLVAVHRETGAIADRLPTWAVRAWRPAGWGLGLLLGLAALLVIGAFGVRWPTVSSVHDAVGVGGAGALVLVLGQLLFVPNLLLWALSVVAGPGFEVAVGSTVSLTGSSPGLVPMVPILGLVPPEGQYSSWLWLAVLLPVAVGVVVGRQVGRQWARLARWQDKVLTAATAVTAVSVAVGALSWLGSGSAGGSRLAHVGSDPVAVAAAVLAELSVGVGAWLLVDAVRQRWVR